MGRFDDQPGTSRHFTPRHYTSLHNTGETEMYRAIVTIKGMAPYSQSRQHRTDFLAGESQEAYDLRTWREKCNYDKDGNVFVPAMAFKQGMDIAAKRLAIPDPDNKKANFTKY